MKVVKKMFKNLDLKLLTFVACLLLGNQKIYALNLETYLCKISESTSGESASFSCGMGNNVVQETRDIISACSVSSSGTTFLILEPKQPKQSDGDAKVFTVAHDMPKYISLSWSFRGQAYTVICRR